MALDTGNMTANSGMSKAIYDQINSILSPTLGDMANDDMEEIRDSWKKLAYAVAKGVIDHIASNMEIYAIHTQGNVNTSASGSITSALTGPHTHTHGISNLTGDQADVEFTQNDDGIGHVR